MNDVLKFISARMERDRKWDVECLKESIARYESTLKHLYEKILLLRPQLDELERAIILLSDQGMGLAENILDCEFYEMASELRDLEDQAHETEKALSEARGALEERSVPTDLSVLEGFLEGGNNG